MPMSKEDHNQRLERLLDPELSHADKSEILQELRVDYGTFHADFETVTQDRDKLNKVKDDLIISNSQLFRQLGSNNDQQKAPEEEKQNFSETVTVSAIEKGL